MDRAARSVDLQERAAILRQAEELFMQDLPFIPVYHYVNLELVGPTLNLAPAYLGLVYLVFLPSLLTTPMAGRYARKYGARRVFWAASAVAGLGLALALSPSLWPVLAGLALIAVGTFFAQAAATGYVGRTAKRNHAAANGLYLTSYYAGGLAGALVLGQVYGALGWAASVLVLAVALLIACGFAWALHETASDEKG